MRHLRRDCGSQHTRKKSLDFTDPKSRSGVAKIMETCSGLFFSHVFCNESPYAESVILHFSKRSVEEVLRPRSNTNSKKTTFFQKKTLIFLFFAFGGNLYCYADPRLDLEPVWEALFCTVTYVNSFAKIFGICPISQRRYSCFLGSLRQSVSSGPLQNHALMKIKVFARKGCKS